MTYFPMGETQSIVGAEMFHYSVRNGKRWVHLAHITKASASIPGTHIFRQVKLCDKIKFAAGLVKRFNVTLPR